MDVAGATQAVRAVEGVADRQAGVVGHLRTHQGLHGFSPQSALGQGGTVVRSVGRAGAHDAKAPEGIAQADGNELGHARVFGDLLHGLQRDVARRHVDVEHARQNELHGAAFGTHHRVNPGQIALKSPVHLFAGNPHKRNAGQAQRQQQQVQRGRQGARPQVAKGNCYYLHSCSR